MTRRPAGVATAATAAVLAILAPRAHAAPRLSVTPRGASMDTPVVVRVAGLPPVQEVTLRASAPDAEGRPWQSEATFRATPKGIVDLSAQPSLSGTYTGIDAMGLFWSMRPLAIPAPLRRRAGPAARRDLSGGGDRGRAGPPRRRVGGCFRREDPRARAHRLLPVGRTSPSTAKRAAERLRRRSGTLPVEHFAYDDCAHTVPDGFFPPSHGGTLGGSAPGTMRAFADYWPRLLRFLEASIGTPPRIE